ncbi:MAG: matrixin family metalloprotease, partial [Acidobacteria bacterium]|nr:matrixin family metalloprotease [Acidobacteriota bacterium]
ERCGPALSPLLASEQRAFVVEFHADVATEDARALIREAGFESLARPALLPGELLVVGDLEAVAALAEWDEVAYVFPASVDLISGAPVVGCAGALTEAGLIGQYVSVGNGWSRDGSGEVEVGYSFGNLTSRLAASAVKSEMVRAFEEWAKYAPLRFREAAGANASRTIAVLFASRSHGDPYPFDGPGRVLAHTFYPAPPNPEPIAGDMHLDNDENWQLGTGIDLFTVALHEAGHALGLGHSDRPGSVMYPYYRLGASLTDDDIAGIQALYGSRETAEPPVEPPAQPPQPPQPPKSEPLVLAILNPAAALETTAAWITVSGTAGGGTAPVRVLWRSDRGQSGTASGSLSWTIASVPLEVGANRIAVSATDAAGGVVSKSIAVTRKAPPASPPQNDSTPPALRITSPGFTIASTSAASITVRGTASDSGGVASVTWTNSVGGSGEASGTENWTATVNLRQGTNTITIRAFDVAGNSSWRSLTVVRQ